MPIQKVSIDPIFATPRIAKSDRFQKPLRPYQFGASPLHLRPVLSPSEREAVPPAGGYVRA